MADYFLVTIARGPAWDPARSRRNQPGWDEHAAFMDALTAEGIVVLGGPVGDVDDGDVLLVLDVASEDAARRCLLPDPWHGSVLRIASVEPWSVWLRAPGRS
jgi:hypothetical protein